VIFSFQQLVTAPTSASIRATMVRGLVGLGVPANQWRAGGVASSMLTIVARTFAGFAATLTAALGAAFLGVATGPWLRLLAFYVFGVTPNEGSFASGIETLTNSGGGVYTFAAGTFTIANPTTGQRYINTTPFTLGAMTSIAVAFQAVVVGSIASAGAGTISQVITSAVGVSCSNPAPFVGVDADTDAQVVAKCQAARAGRSYLGPEGAYLNAIYKAKNALGNPLNINRIRVVSAGDMAVTVYVASPGGVPTPADIAAAQAAVLLIAQPMNVTATVVACTPVTWAPPVTLWCTAQAPVPTVVTQEATAAILAYVALYPIGGLPRPPSTQGYLYASAAAGVLKGADPTIYDVQGITQDEAIAVGQVLVWDGTLTVRTLAVAA
jgi:hypothetical protein